MIPIEINEFLVRSDWQTVGGSVILEYHQHIALADKIRMLLNVAGDNSCHLSGNEVSLPPVSEFLESCKRHHEQVTKHVGVLTGCKTIAQLELENMRLRDCIRKIQAEVVASITLEDYHRAMGK